MGGSACAGGPSRLPGAPSRPPLPRRKGHHARSRPQPPRADGGDLGDAPGSVASDGRFCLAGMTGANVLEICRDNGISARETPFSLPDVYSAREAFVTGTFAGVVPVRSVDGRTIGNGRRGPMVERLQALYREFVDADVATRVAP